MIDNKKYNKILNILHSLSLLRITLFRTDVADLHAICLTCLEIMSTFLFRYAIIQSAERTTVRVIILK